MSIELTDAEREALCSPIGNDEAYPELPGVVADIVAARVASALAPIEALTYASDDGTEYEHNGHDPSGGEPECPGCWVATIRAALSSHQDPTDQPAEGEA